MDPSSSATQPPSAVTLVNRLLADAVARGASDIHIEPGRERVRVRYRIDGRMCFIAPFAVTLLPSIVARVKIMCSMDVSETRKPQDGGCLVPVSGHDIELRASTLPGTHGEIVVLRLLTREGGLIALDRLGFEAEMLRDLRRLLAARQGMLLITGPTGSGKTTTLYAALSHLNTDDVNIITVEDPVEVDLDGINQVQIHDRAGRSFANTLRAMLRQDPDVIMVGEMRDLETAEIGCRAALTGHLVLSTVHTQHTLGTLTRLFDIGIPPYLAASALNGVLAQRLTRKVCASCGVDYVLPPALRRLMESQLGSLEGARFRRGKGCNLCSKTGTRGRIAVFELLPVDDELRHLIAEASPPNVLQEFVARRGYRSLEQDAFRKAAQGLIPPEEIIKLGFGLALAAEDADLEESPAGGTARATPEVSCGSMRAGPPAG